MGDTSSNGTGAYAAANYMGVTANATSPVNTDTSLAGEVVSGSLVRVQCAYAHTMGTSSYTLSNTFTSDQTIILAKIGIFNASSSGTMVFETLLNAVVSMITGDQVLIVETVDI
jgi:hypothetical protein